jgi:hypothetical protein
VALGAPGHEIPAGQNVFGITQADTQQGIAYTPPAGSTALIGGTGAPSSLLNSGAAFTPAPFAPQQGGGPGGPPTGQAAAGTPKELQPLEQQGLGGLGGLLGQANKKLLGN